MSTIEKLTELARQLPEEKMNNALALLKDMQTVVVGVDDNDRHWRPSIFRIVQAMTDTDSIDGELVDKVAGSLVIGSQAYGAKKMGVHVLRAWDSKKMWDPDVNVKKIVCQSPDAKTGWRFGDCKKCEHSKWADNKTPSPCKAEKSFMVITSDFRHVVEISFKSTHLAIGNEWQGLVKKSSKPAYQRVYELSSEKHPDKKTLFRPVVGRTESYADGVEDKFLEEMFMYFREQRTKYIEGYYASISSYQEKKMSEANEADEQVVHVRVATPVEESGEPMPDYKF